MVKPICTTPSASPEGFGTSPFMRKAQKGGGKKWGVRGKAPYLSLGSPFHRRLKGELAGPLRPRLRGFTLLTIPLRLA